MHIELIPVETFTLRLGSHEIEGVRVASRWNGMIELRVGASEKLIVSELPQNSMHETFSSMFGEILGAKKAGAIIGASVISGSPELLDRLMTAHSAGTKAKTAAEAK